MFIVTVRMVRMETITVKDGKVLGYLSRVCCPCHRNWWLDNIRAGKVTHSLETELCVAQREPQQWVGRVAWVG